MHHNLQGKHILGAEKILLKQSESHRYWEDGLPGIVSGERITPPIYKP